MNSLAFDFSSEEDIEYDPNSDFDDFIDDTEEKLQELEDDIKSITSFCLSPEDMNSQNIDIKLKATLSSREYDKISQQAQKKALKSYQSLISSEYALLQQNHINMQREYGISNDDSWEIDSTKSTDLELLVAITKLRKKISKINSENQSIFAENEKSTERLQQIYDQNVKLEQMKNTQCE
ncbi:hypothetical protein M9Y10_012442 [Tritrichomonas musculus]|uniref:Uncharacterized protein n=1 Tax=Tritrichomonas musculus TaxID=1915356 RepID=A0ABR2ICQ0_9EUKA